MAYLMDSGFLYSSLNKKEKYHSETIEILASIYEEIILPVPAVTEIAYLILRDLGTEPLTKFLEDLPEMNRPLAKVRLVFAALPLDVRKGSAFPCAFASAFVAPPPAFEAQPRAV